MLELIPVVLAAAAIPLIFFSIVIGGVKLSMAAGESLGGMTFMGWVVYMTGVFWSLGLAVGACIGWVLWMQKIL